MGIESPNVLMISIDSLRADFCSFLNQSETTTPFLESIAESSAVFPNAISPSCWTLQVHGSVFTGLYPPEHQVLDKGVQLGDHPTIAQALEQANYNTQSFGYNGWLETGDILRGFDHHTTPTLADSTFERILKKAEHGAFVHTIRDSLTVKSLETTLTEGSEPFFHFLHLDDVHYIYTPRRPYHRLYTSKSLPRLSLNLLRQRRLFDNRSRTWVGAETVSETDLEIMQNLYRGCIRQADDMLQSIFQTLDAQNLLDDTIVVVFGDHGDHFGEKGFIGHQFSVGDELIRVPLLIYDPTDQLEDGIHEEVVQLNDVYPTILEMTGMEPPETNSVSLLSDETRDQAYTYYSAADSLIKHIQSNVAVNELPPQRQYAVWRSPEEKAVYYPNDDEWDGPAADDSELRTALETHQSALNPVDPIGDSDVSEDVLDNLEQMGYI